MALMKFKDLIAKLLDEYETTEEKLMAFPFEELCQLAEVDPGNVVRPRETKKGLPDKRSLNDRHEKKALPPSAPPKADKTKDQTKADSAGRLDRDQVIEALDSRDCPEVIHTTIDGVEYTLERNPQCSSTGRVSANYKFSGGNQLTEHFRAAKVDIVVWSGYLS